MKRGPGFLAFAADQGVTFTPAQQALYSVAFDGAAPAGDLARAIFGDVGEVPPLARDVVVILKGARVGGSRFGALRLVHLAVTVDLSGLAPGELASALIVGPDLRLARQAYRFALGAVQATPKLARLLEGDPTKEAFVLRRRDGRRVIVECLPATRGGSALRARSLVGALLTECAFFYDGDYVINDGEIFRAVAPRIVPGGQTILESTPWAESGLLHELFAKNHGKPTTALAAHCPTLLMRPDERTAAIVAAERERDPDNAAREFDAEFLAAGTGLFFDAKAIDVCVDASLMLPVDPESGGEDGPGKKWIWKGRCHCAGDAAFSNDSSALAVVGKKGDVFHLLAIDEVKPKKGEPLRPSVVVHGWAALASRYACPFVAADPHYKESVREHLEREKLDLRDAPNDQWGKAFTYLELRKAINEKRIRLPKHDRLISQLKKITSKPTPGGGLKISSPRARGGGHGDLVSALVLAVWAHRQWNAEMDCTIHRGRSSRQSGGAYSYHSLFGYGRNN